MIELLTVTDENTADWLALKQRTVGSSEIAAICGLNPWKSPLHVWMEKTGKIDPQIENDDLWLGKQAETLVARMFQKKHPEYAALRAQVLIAHDEYPWATCTPDFWLYAAPEGTPENYVPVNGRRGILETKFQKIHALDSWDDEVPATHFIQAVWQQGITGVEGVYIASLVGGFNYREAGIEPSPDIFDGLLCLADDFMKLVREDVPPNAGPGDSKLIRQLYPNGSDDLRIVPIETASKYLAEWRIARDELERLNGMVKDEERRKKAAENQLRLMTAGATNIQFMEGETTRGTMKVSTVNVKAHSREAYSYERCRIAFLDEDGDIE